MRRTRVTAKSKENIFTVKETKNLEFWKDRIKDNNEKSWSSSNIHDSYSRKIDTNVQPKSWFSIKESKNTNHQDQNTNIDRNAFAYTKIDDYSDIKIQKVGLKLKSDQKVKVKNWMDISRYVYNLCITFLTKRLLDYKKGIRQENISRQSLRETIIGKRGYKPLDAFVYECPADVLDGAVNDALLAYKAVISNRAAGKKSKLNYRKKKSVNSIVISTKAVTNNTIYSRKLGEIMFKDKRDSVNMSIDGDSRLVYSKVDGYTLHKIIKNKTPAYTPVADSQSKKVIALDPGIRTFLTAYSPSGITDIGENAAERLMKLRNTKMSIQMRLEDASCRKKRRMKLACDKIQKKIKGLTDELHWKTINYLMKFDVIILPQFNVKSIIKRSNPKIGRVRKINKSVVTKTLLLQHYKFRQRLINKIKLSDRHKLFIVNEAYTSKTCSDCGNINKKLGGSKTFDCSACSMKLDRDVNGARNIFNKYVNIL